MNPFFLPTPAGRLFCIHYPPTGTPLNQAIVHVPAFGDEMNKSRRMVATQAREFAARGFSVLVADLFGTGDSSGEFGEATWDIWLRNIESAIDWLTQQGTHSVSLWGLRSGALLSMDFAGKGLRPVDRLICWQPVLNGDTFVTQFLRLRVAAAVMDSNAPREKTSELKQRIIDGEAVEVAGYWLNSDLIKPLITLRAERLPLGKLQKVSIFEVVNDEEVPPSPLYSQLLDHYLGKDIVATMHKVVGDTFWTTQEITTAPKLIALTNEQVEQWL